MTSPSPRRGPRPAAFAAALLVSVSLGGALPLSADAAPAGPSAGTAARTAAAPALNLQEWLYPGPATDVTCSAPSEYADGRVQHGVLKAEYIDIDENGDPTELLASNPAYACNGYSAANAADVKAHSAQQYLTLSLADLTSEENLTGNPAKSAAAISTVTAFTRSIGFTGVDVDFENYWSWVGDDQADYYAFLTHLATALHADGLKLQVEGPPDTTTGFNYGTVLKDGADQVVMMAYDDEYQSPVGSSCLAFSPYSWMRSLITGALAEIPAAQQSRFVAGLPAEAYSATGQCQDITGNLAFSDMQKAPGYSSDPAVIASRRDPGSGEIRWSSGGTFYDYVDQTALDSKLALVESLGVDTVSVWTLGGGNPWFSRSIGTSTPYVSKATGRCLDDPGNATANGTRVDVWDCSGAPGQTFAYGAGNTMTVMGKCLDASGNRTTAGTPVIVYSCNGGANQEWSVNGDGSITGVQSGLCLDVTGGATAGPNGTGLELWPCTGEANESWTAAG
jgi:hypothetical protein